MKIIKHIIKEDSREHVLYYDNHGVHCSEPNCEINQKNKHTIPADKDEAETKSLFSYRLNVCAAMKAIKESSCC